MSQARGDAVAATWEYKGAQLEVIKRSMHWKRLNWRDWYYCGYVTFASDPFPGTESDFSAFYDLEVHGGLTYKSDATYGFDCAHGTDFLEDSPAGDLGYVKAQTESLCDQVIALREEKDGLYAQLER